MFLDRFKEAQERANGNAYTSKFGVMEQASVKAFLTAVASKLLDDKTCTLAESQEFTEGFVRHLVQPSTLKVPVACFVTGKCEKGVTTEVRFREELSRELHVKKKIMSLSPLTGR